MSQGTPSQLYKTAQEALSMPQKYTNSQFDYFQRESQIQSAQRYAYFKTVFLPYFAFGIPTAFITGVLFSRLNVKNLRYTLLKRFSRKETSALTLQNEKLREVQMRKLRMKFPDYDHFVPVLILPLLGAIGYTSYNLYSNHLQNGRNIRDVEREKFNILNDEAYRTFSRD